MGAQQKVVVYDDGLGPSWHDWSYSVDRDLASTMAPHAGSNDIAVTQKGWGALALQNPDGIDVKGLTTLSFWVNGGASGGQKVLVVLNADAGMKSADALPALAPGWKHVEVKLSSLGLTSGMLKTIWFKNATGDASPVYYLDDIEIY
jgi:hypothetical protein